MSATDLLTRFTIQFSSLLNAGVPIVRCLRILAAQQRAGAFRAIADAVREDVETGSSLSEAMARHPRVFDTLYTNMIRAGEAGGVLDVILDRLAAYLEKAQALKRQVVGAMIYPSVVVTIAATVVLGIMTWIVPQFSKVFRDLGIELPSLTLLLMSISDFITSVPGFISLIVDRVHDSVREGESIAAPLGASGAFDDIVVNMIDIGEETGELDRMLLKIADTADAEVDAAVAGLMSVLEPVMIVGLGVTVGFIVIALFMPLLVILESMG